MNNHNNHNSEPRLDENPFNGVIQRALLYQQDVSTDTAWQRSVGSEYGAAIGHGTIWPERECEVHFAKQRRSQQMYTPASPQAIACKDMHHDEQEAIV
ncbi:MAG: hypothetical protein U9Q37_04750 [Euryarchaeota archaeon]|nr:hypothetical protein [Euryarchaeota archaeon]